jgi:signal transduction histidine kinase
MLLPAARSHQQRIGPDTMTVSGQDHEAPARRPDEAGLSLAEDRHALRGRLANLELYLGLLETGPIERRAHYLGVLHHEVELMAAIVDALGRPEAES